MSTNKWPILPYKEDIQPHFLFILTLPYSGSTALTHIINTSPRTTILHEKGEGQWIIPGLCEVDRWDKNKHIELESIKSVWLNKYQKISKTTQPIDVVVEKSPPNMMRIEKLILIFKNYSFIANNRNPYAVCASMLYRNYKSELKSQNSRIVSLEHLAHSWISRSYRLKELIIKFDIPLLTYEQFCNNPYLIKSKLQLPKGVAESINPKAKVKVKDYECQTIINQNKRQILNLTNKDKEILSSIFCTHKNLLNFFNYKLI